MIKVRFAPSPTGYLHIGGARTALFNWMYAKAQSGCFVLRVEDTDRERSKKEYFDEILQSMTWLGLKWDEIYQQTERFDLYREYAQQLLMEGLAFRDGDAVILKTPLDQEIKFFDIIRGEITFDTSSFVDVMKARDPATADGPSVALKDQVLMKSDGSPAYNFACVLDDALMEITHVIRGEDHISNTPKQLLIYEALRKLPGEDQSFKSPKYAHLPLIMGADGGRMSKRTGAVAVSDYRKAGYLPEALVNYLLLLGWSPGNNQEILSLESAVKKFSLKRINKAAAVFSMDKLKWVNTQYIKKMPVGELTNIILPFLKNLALLDENYDPKWLEEVVRLYQGRMTTVTEFIERTSYLFAEELLLETDIKNKHALADRKKEFKMLQEQLSALAEFNAATAENAFRSVVAELGIKAGDLVHPVRVALTGSDVGPGLFETMGVLGKEKTIARLHTVVEG